MNLQKKIQLLQLILTSDDIMDGDVENDLILTLPIPLRNSIKAEQFLHG